MSERGILQLSQTDFTRYENYSTRLQGSYKLTLVNVSALLPSGGGTDDIAFEVDINQLSHLQDNNTKLSFIHTHNGASILCSPLEFPETFINGQILFSGLNMGALTKLILTFHYEKC